MKRATSLVLFVLALSAAGCGKKKTVTTLAPSTPAPPAAEAAATPISGETAGLVFKSVHFALNRADLTAEATKTLVDGARRLLADPALRIRVEGHADERGETEYNLALSERRAAAIRAYLLDLGIKSERIETVAFGEEKPVSKAQDESGWAANRRGELRVNGGASTNSR